MPAVANSDRLVRYFGRSNVVGSGLLLITFGMLLFGTVVDINAEYWIYATVFVVLGLAWGSPWPPQPDWSWNRFPTTKPVSEAPPTTRAGKLEERWASRWAVRC